MKTRKNSKLLILAVSLALLICSVIGITASAEEATGDLSSITINHADKIGVAFVVKATQAEINNGTVAVKYTWEGGEEQTAVYHSAHPTKAGYVYVVTNGVAAYDLTKTLTFTVYTNGVAGETGTYSVATFLYNKLYRDNIEAGAQRDVYETLIAYGAASQVLFNVDTENLVDDLDYVYSKNANVKFGGKSYVLGSTAVTATYSGTGNVEAWIINGQEIASTATTYDVTVDGVVSVDVKVQCVHADVNPKDHNCDYCGANEFGTCEDADKNHKCDYCDATLSECADTDNDHYCNVCSAKLSDCVDEGKDHVCDICKGNVGDHTDTDNDHNCNYCGEKLTDCTNENDDHYCDICETKLPCVDEDNDHKCDICLEGSDCWDNDGNYRCDGCGVYSFNSNMTDGEHGMIIYQGQSNLFDTTADTVTYSNQVTGADRPAGYNYGAYYSIANDPTGIANKVLQVNMPARVVNGGQYMSSHVRFTPDGEGDLLVFDTDMYLSSENTPLVDGLYIYLVDDSVFNYDPQQGVAEPDNQAGQGYHKIIIQTMEPTDDGTVYIRMGGNKTNAVADTWFSVRVVVNAATKSYSMYYSIDGGETYLASNANWSNRTTNQVDLSKITSVGFKANTYRPKGEDKGLSYDTYVDNVELYKTNCFSFTANNDPWKYCFAIDENSDHLCDVCRKPTCVDATGNDGKCDICGALCFEGSQITSGMEGYTYSEKAYSASTTTIYKQTTINADAPAEKGKYGSYYQLVTDPADASNQVLKFTSETASSVPGDKVSYINLTHEDMAEANKVHVITYDIYLESSLANANLLYIYFRDTDGNNIVRPYGLVTKVKATAGTVTENAFQVLHEVGYTSNKQFNSSTWYKFIFVWDRTTGTYDMFVSTDNGATWTDAYTNKEVYKVSDAAIGSVHLETLNFNNRTVQYYDNISYNVYDSFSIAGVNFGNAQ